VVIVVGLLAIVRLIPGVQLGALWAILAQTIVYSAYAFVVINARFTAIAALYEDAAYDLGASTGRVLRTVILPLLAPSVLVGALMAFTFSLDAVVSVVFLGGPHTETIPILIMGMIKKGVTPEVNAIGVIVMLFNLLVLAVIVKVVGIKQTVATAGGNSSGREAK
jgi:ABC-type spermidine/putrescine transport system permease subunit II